MRTKEVIKLDRFIFEITSWNNIKVCVNKKNYKQIMWYNNQLYISDKWLKVISLKRRVKLKKYIKNIYII